jgi:alanyl-tRNA synthetase
MTGDELREKFLVFFEQKGHLRVKSAPLIPHGDPTLLLTSAGMVQFKPYFTGDAVPPSPRLASCQKCFRTTDIGSVGNFKHLTFFEMLGNFSIGDYFKKEAIAWAWEFVLDWLKIPREKLWITIFLDDDESFGYWQDVGVSAERIMRCGEKDNFWGPAGETGPCGPCSEIHYDFGEQFSCGPDCSPSCGCGRFLEIWNLVFTEYYQDAQKKRTPLPRKNIDTGMGLERTATVIQGKRSFYDTDLFAPIVQKVSQLTGLEYGENEKADRAIRIVAEHGRAVTFLIADGVIPSNEGRGYVLRRILRRAAYFGETLSHDKPFLTEVAKEVTARMGHIYPELVVNRETILRVMGAEVDKFREALLVGKGILNQTIFQLREELVNYFPKFENAFQDAVSLRDGIKLPSRVREAVDLFLRDCQAWEHVLSVGDRDAVKETLGPIDEGLSALKRAVSNYNASSGPNALDNLKKRLQEQFQQIKINVHSISKKLSGYELFILHDTYGFPVELTTEIAADNGLSIDMEGFEAEMEQQRERARAAHKFTVRETISLTETVSVVIIPRSTDFVGYRKLIHKSPVVVLLPEGKWPEHSVDFVSEGQEVGIILRETPFYAEMGGQVGDEGEIRGKKGRVEITNAIKITKGQSDLIVHLGKVVEGTISINDIVEAEVDKERRLDIARNHTATHLLHAALRQVLGSQVHQAGSLVAPDRFRFDFTYEAPVLKEELSQIQRIVNESIRQNLPVTKKEMPYTQAVTEGAIALFGEKYGDVVRTVRVGQAKSPLSFEVCGGTHLERTGDIGFFQIVNEGSIGSGMRRIEAVTGRGAEKLIEERASLLDKIAQQLQVPAANIESKIASTLEELDSERKRAVSLERQLSKETAESLLTQAESVKGVSVLAVKVSASSMDALRHMGDVLREKLGSGVIVLAAAWDDKPNFLAVVTPDLVSKGLNAGDIVKKVAQATGGSGGGRPQLGQGGGKDKDKLEEALKLVANLVAEKV